MEALALTSVPEGGEPEVGVSPSVVDFFDLTQSELGDLLVQRFNAPRYRARQLFDWVYRKGVRDFSQMSNLGREARSELEGVFVFPRAAIQSRQVSVDGTRKYLIQLEGGDLVESVMIKQPTRMTLCVSSQVGCGMGCKFCRTATMGLKRNLKTSEIVQQVQAVVEDAKNFNDNFDNIVFMGMGEPLHNFKGVTGAMQVLLDPFAFNLSGRKITVSSVGLVPAITKFGATKIDVNLAISLNATTDEVRSEVMPINKRYPIAELMQCLRDYPLKNRRKITIEYVMLHGVNDTVADLKRLPKLLRGIPVKVNLIPYNENAGLGFRTPPREWIERWHAELMGTGVDCTIRWSKGQDINAACGQLAVKRERASVLAALV